MRFRNHNPELAAVVFPLPEELKEQYVKWAKSSKPPYGKRTNQNEADTQPVFIPIYPNYPGYSNYPVYSNCPGTVPIPYYPAWPGTDCGRSSAPASRNPYIIFLIFVLIILGFKKEQILESIRKMLLKSKKAPPG